jgi:hypothetical protein
MKIFVKSLLVALVAGVCFGCASDNPSESPQPRSSSSPTTGPSTSSSDDQAVSVSFRKSGGLKPVDERSVFSADSKPPAGYSASDVDKILAVASNPRIRDLPTSRMPVDQCCDRQSYQVTITWADGSSRTLTTIDGVDRPQLFDDLLSALG